MQWSWVGRPGTHFGAISAVARKNEYRSVQRFRPPNRRTEVALYDGRAVEIGYSEGCDELWVIGGAEIYGLMLQRCEEIHITTVHTTVEGDTRFPDWDRTQWVEKSSKKTLHQSMMSMHRHTVFGEECNSGCEHLFISECDIR